jgi:uncharacterized protein YcnI
VARAAIACAVAAAGIAASAIPAFAHITITPGSAATGSAAVLTFHIPNEEAAAYTTRVDVRVPTDHPIAQLLVEPVAGWTVSVRTVTLAKPLVTDDGQFTQAVSEVIWSGGRIPPGQFQDFSLSADPLPQGVTQLTFKTIQTYSNGDVVRWIDVPAPGQPAPDHPAPQLTLTTGTGVAVGAAAAAVPPAAVPPASGATSASDGTARAIAAGGVLIGLLGLALAGLGWRRAKALTVRELPQPALNGDGLAAAGSAPAGAARGAPRRKGASGRRGPSHR